MRILSFNQYPDFTPEREFKETWVTKLISMLAATVLLAGTIVAFTHVSQRFAIVFCIVTGTICGLWALASAVSMVRTRHPANWLMRASTRTIWIKFRTYRNVHLSPDDPQIIELDQKEIAWARALTLHKIGPDLASRRRESGGTESERIEYLEIGLVHVDTRKLPNVLKREEHVKLEKWGHKSLDYAVTVTADGTLRLRWSNPYRQIRPGLKTVLEFISHFAEVRPPAKETVNYTVEALSKLPEDQQRIRLAELARLEPVEVIMVAQRIRKCSTAEAKAYVDGL